MTTGQSKEMAQVLASLDRLESKDAIREMATAYAIACDEQDMPRLTNLFTDDATFDAPNGAMVADGKAAIVAMFEETFKIRGPAYHWTHDITIEMDPQDPDKATRPPAVVPGHTAANSARAEPVRSTNLSCAAVHPSLDRRA